MIYFIIIEWKIIYSMLHLIIIVVLAELHKNLFESTDE